MKLLIVGPGANSTLLAAAVERLTKQTPIIVEKVENPNTMNIKPQNVFTFTSAVTAIAAALAAPTLKAKYRGLPVVPLHSPTRWGVTRPGWRAEAKHRRWKELSRRQRRNRRMARV